jgi:hypothetical protein
MKNDGPTLFITLFLISTAFGDINAINSNLNLSYGLVAFNYGVTINKINYTFIFDSTSQAPH